MTSKLSQRRAPKAKAQMGQWLTRTKRSRSATIFLKTMQAITKMSLREEEDGVKVSQSID
jgi:hypothetical protein